MPEREYDRIWGPIREDAARHDNKSYPDYGSLDPNAKRETVGRTVLFLVLLIGGVVGMALIAAAGVV